MSSASETTTNQLAMSSSSLPMTAVVFAVISIVLYVCLFKPLFSPAAAPPQPTRQTTTRGGINGQRQRRRNNQNNHADSNVGDIRALLADHTQCPPHMAPASAARYLDTGGISLLSDGLLPFRHGRAAAYEASSIDSNAVASNRKDRARVISRILSLDDGSGMSPPSRGSTVVISIPSRDVGSEKLSRVLYLLSTHFNTLLILSVAPGTTDNDIDALVETLRGSSLLPADVLPRHRIVAAQSITGRVAFVRQLGRVEFVLDFEEEMRSQLGRFGFRVVVYPGELGSTLLA